MAVHTYKVIGLMSGTSLDGLDIAYCKFYHQEQQWSFEIKKTAHIPYSTDLYDRLQHAVTLNAIDVLALHNEYGVWLGQQTAAFIAQHELSIDFIASHGHTVHHQPQLGITYQIGSGQHIANITNTEVICDFRTNDVALGGQGAPLVPIGDRWLFGAYDYCLNLGGISNVSFESNQQRIAYDIAPANMLLNHICTKIQLPYDDGGQLAKSGSVNSQLLQQLNALLYYTKKAPKSLGYEWFTSEIIPLVEATDDTIPNVLCTAIEHIAMQIALDINTHATSPSTLLITGGGAKNHFLIERLQTLLHDMHTIHVPDALLIDYKEALVFAFLGVLRHRNEINCLRSVTGARTDSSSGVRYLPTLS